MTARIAEVPLVGGHRALDLVNTVAPRLPASQREDYLAEPADLLTWSRRSGLLDAAAADEVREAWTASPPAGQRALTAVREIRESLYGVLSAYLGGTEGSAAAREQREHLSTAWAAVQPRARLMPAPGTDHAARWVLGSPPALIVADRVTQDAVELLAGVSLARLGRCPVEDGGCGWLFLDHSRNRSRRWCTMGDCGSEAKARRLTERRRQSRTQPG